LRGGSKSIETTQPSQARQRQGATMKAKKSRKLERAIDAFGELPPEVLALGRPMSVHGPNAAARFGQQLASPKAKKHTAMAFTIALPVIGVALVSLYACDVPAGKAPPVAWLAMAGGMLLFGLLAGGFWWRLARSSGVDEEPEMRDSIPGVILFPDALVQADNGVFTIIRWDEVDELHAPALANCWRTIAKDGRQVDISGWLEDEATAIESTVARVTAVLLPRFLASIEAGKKVMFGPFGVSARNVYYKDKKLSWDDVTSMRMLTGAAVGLQIFHGGLLPWCTYHLLKAPNGVIADEVIRRVAPPRLLTPA
jgi:Family of unknown function (DUF6585)